VALVLMQFLGGEINARFDLQGAADEGRVETYRATLKMIADHPWFGTGQGTFVWSYPAYRSSAVSMGGTWGGWMDRHLRGPGPRRADPKAGSPGSGIRPWRRGCCGPALAGRLFTADTGLFDRGHGACRGRSCAVVCDHWEAAELGFIEITMEFNCIEGG
jgi:hypothetical protein